MTDATAAQPAPANPSPPPTPPTRPGEQVLGPTMSDGTRGCFWNACKVPCRIFTTLMFDLKAYGSEHVPRTGGALLISNHQSNLDPILLGVQLKRQVSFIAKSELFERPVFRWLIRNLNAFAVRRGQTDVAAIKEALHRIKEGQVLTLFPEGTRSRDGKIGPIQPGIAMIVRRAETPVIPAVIDGAHEAWPRGSACPRPTPIRVMYGPPLRLDGLKSEAVVSLIRDTLNRMLLELRAKSRGEPAGG